MFARWVLIALGPLVIAVSCAPTGQLVRPDVATRASKPAIAEGPRWLTRCDPIGKFPIGSTLQVIQVRRPTRGSNVDVRVRSDKSPVVLLLASAKPVIWRLDAEPRADIRGIIVAGHVAQIQGADAQVAISRCDPPRNLISSGQLVDQVADFLALPVEAVQRASVDEGFDITSRRYPNFDDTDRNDVCRVDFDYGGENITRGYASSMGGCRALCDKYGPSNADQGRVTCVVNGRPAWAYPARPGYLSRSCRFEAIDGRNIRSYPATSARECLDTICYTGELFTSTDIHDRWESRCVFQGKTIKRFHLKPWPWLQEPFLPPIEGTSTDASSSGDPGA